MVSANERILDVRRVALLATVVATLLALSGCGSDGESPEEGAGQRVELSFEGDEAPSVERVEVEAGEEIELVITSDQPGELHVHSSPEQAIDYGSGTSTHTLTIDRPGVVDVERHEPAALVLQLEVG